LPALLSTFVSMFLSFCTRIQRDQAESFALGQQGSD